MLELLVQFLHSWNAIEQSLLMKEIAKAITDSSKHVHTTTEIIIIELEKKIRIV